jgi:hypothetical protein
MAHLTILLILKKSWDNVISIATRLWIGQSGVQFPAGVRDSSVLRNIQTGSGTHPASYIMGTEVPSRGLSGWGMMLTTHFQLAPKLRMNGAIPLLPLYAFMA